MRKWDSDILAVCRSACSVPAFLLPVVSSAPSPGTNPARGGNPHYRRDFSRDIKTSNVIQGLNQSAGSKESHDEFFDLRRGEHRPDEILAVKTDEERGFPYDVILNFVRITRGVGAAYLSSDEKIIHAVAFLKSPHPFRPEPNISLEGSINKVKCILLSPRESSLDRKVVGCVV